MELPSTFFRPKVANRSNSQGQRPWFRSPASYSGLKGRPFDVKAASDVHFKNGRPFRPQMVSWLTTEQGRWPWLFEPLAFWAEKQDLGNCHEPLIRKDLPNKRVRYHCLTAFCHTMKLERYNGIWRRHCFSEDCDAVVQTPDLDV